MRRKPAFTIREGHVTLPVYKYADGRYCIAWRKFKGAKLQRETRTTEKAARARAREIAIAINNGRADVLELTSADRESYLHAKQLLAATGLPLHEAVEHFVLHRRSRIAVTARQILDRLLLKYPEPQSLGEQRYIRAIRNDLKKYVQRFPRLEGSAHDIREYLSALSVGPRRRDNVLSLIKMLHNFAKTRDGGELFSRDRDTEADLVSPLNVPTTVTTYSPDELRLILRFASRRWIPFFATAGFSGPRPSEILRFDWSYYKWTEPCIAIPGHVARKTTHPRRAEFPPILQEWLADWRGAVGPLYPHHDLRAQKKLEEELSVEIANIKEQISEATGQKWTWQNDALRHSYGSYRYAQVKSFGAIADWMGNSIPIVKKRYFDSKSEDEANAWFGVTQKEAANVIQANFRFA